MSDLLTTGGVLAAFFAGGVALFAPCCIVFLAPSYLAGAVKNRRWRLLPLTFLFAAGLASILVPITVGISLIAAAIAKYHAVLYWAGGILPLENGGQVVLEGPAGITGLIGEPSGDVEDPGRFERSSEVGELLGRVGLGGGHQDTSGVLRPNALS